MQHFLALVVALACVASVASFFSHSGMMKVAMRSSAARSLQMSTTVDPAIGAVGSKLTDLDLAKEALALFVGDDAEKTEIVPTSGGVNNIVQYVTLPSGEKQLLRIYNNGLDSQRVRFEHDVLNALNAKNAKAEENDKLSFQVPNFIPSKSGDTMVKLSNGAEACMVELIPGVLPKLSTVQDIGRACGELLTALATLDAVKEEECNCAPYWDMWAVHHAVTEEIFVKWMKSDAFDSVRAAADTSSKDVTDIVARCMVYKTTLPTQLIHGDLHYDNVLVSSQENGKVTGLLDFEFAAFDWRALEIAISLSKYAGEPDAMQYFEKFIDGYAQSATLTKEEVMAIPDLINLRILSNVVYFVGRAEAKEDDISSITTRIENYCNRVTWVKQNAELLTSRMCEKMGL